MKMTLKRAPGFTALSLLLPCLLLGLQAGCTTNQSTASALQRLQGTWGGFAVGYEATDKITLTITGNSIHYHYQTPTANQVFEATFTLPAGTNPQQLRATLTGLPPESDRVSSMEIGEVVPAIFKIEDGTLILADPPSDDSKPFEATKRFHYKLRKVQPQKKNTELPKSK